MANRTKIYSHLGQKIKELRISKELTQKELASKLCKSESTVRMWELGNSEPDINTLKLLSNIFNVSVSYLIGETDEQKSPSNEELKVALFGGDSEVTDEMWDEVMRYAKYIKEKYSKKT